MLETQLFESMHHKLQDVSALSAWLPSNVWQIVGWGHLYYHGYSSLLVFLLLVSLLMLESLHMGPHCFSENSGCGEGCVPIYPKTEYWETVETNKKTTPHPQNQYPVAIDLCLDNLESARADHYKI